MAVIASRWWPRHFITSAASTSLSISRHSAVIPFSSTRYRHSTGIRAQSSSSVQGFDADPNDVKKCLRELAECLVLPSNFLSELPDGLRLDVNDAAFALSNGSLSAECGEKAAEVLMRLSVALEQADTQSTATIAASLPSLAENPSLNLGLGQRLTAAGRYLASTGNYGEGELQKLSKALLAAGKVITVSAGAVAKEEAPVDYNVRTLKFGSLQVQVTPSQAYIGAAVAFAFGLLAWELTSSLQQLADDSLQYSTNNATVIANSLRTTLLAAGYCCTALCVFAMAGLLSLANKVSSDGK